MKTPVVAVARSCTLFLSAKMPQPTAGIRGLSGKGSAIPLAGQGQNDMATAHTDENETRHNTEHLFDKDGERTIAAAETPIERPRECRSEASVSSRPPPLHISSATDSFATSTRPRSASGRGRAGDFGRHQEKERIREFKNQPKNGEKDQAPKVQIHDFPSWGREQPN